ncbi:MAG: N-acetyl-gamma-glutamyl-phosphate reductase [Deltaproteobacteria bacterium]|nr:N-acetyl-gamma-glutamyl-phosphate reductase [Deltaproteobacteria bacterium]
MRAAIIGATGYTGLELIRILSRHPEVEITALTSERYVGQRYDQVYPAVGAIASRVLEPLNADAIAPRADVIFTAVPHKEAMQVVPSFIKKKKKVIDLSADFRLTDKATYETWYDAHTAPELLAKAVYGLPEINRKKIKKAQLVANPGCYPTSIILPLTPLLKDDLIDTSAIIADSKSGVSGAGRSLKTGSLFCEASESFKAYSILKHRHQPEIDEQLSGICGKPVSITFSPHLLPMNRGMLSTIYVTLKRPMSSSSVQNLLTSQYKNEPFVRILPEGTLPQTGWVRGSNYCDIGFALSGRRLVLVSVIDNLVKGASGQAVQNMNIMMGIRETMAVDHVPMYP